MSKADFAKKIGPCILNYSFFYPGFFFFFQILTSSSFKITKCSKLAGETIYCYNKIFFAFQKKRACFIQKHDYMMYGQIDILPFLHSFVLLS